MAAKLLKEAQVRIEEPGKEEYERCVATSNMLFRFSRPECVVLPKSHGEVQRFLQVAANANLKVTIKCGGHSYAGHSTAFEGVSLDLRKLNYVDLEMESANKTVTMGGGCQWGHVYKKLINGHHNGYIINGGRCPSVGVGGFILGGGLGPFTRSFGMGSDTLKEATVVTASGEIVTVSENHHPESREGQLFWALRGAGGGNFGVVVEMKLHVQKLRNSNGMVVAGRYQWFPTSGITDEVVSTMNKFYTTEWPTEMTIDSTWMCDLREKAGDGVRFLTSYNGDKDEFDRIISENIKDKELEKQLKRRCLAERSTRFLHETLVAQWSEETTRAFPSNKTYSIYSSFVFGNDRESIEKITPIIQKEMEAFRSLYTDEKVEFLVTWIHAGGEAQRKPADSSAYFWRKAVYHTYVTLEWEDKWMERDMRGFMGQVKKKLRPHSLDGVAAFINFPDGVFSTKGHENAYFGKNREKLRAIKQRLDPGHFFKWEQGVQFPLPPGADEALDADALNADTQNEEDLTDKIASKQWETFKIDWEKGLADINDYF
ncbi:hypothetical protein MY11210_008135 [Beauveria gryllotalpidicola]